MGQVLQATMAHYATKGHQSKKLVTPYNVRGVPTYILVDREGKEVARGKAAALAAAKKDEA